MRDALPQKSVQFYDDELYAVQQDDGTIFAVFPRLCDNLEVSRSSQARRIKKHAILNEGLVILTLQTPGGPQKAQCLRLDLLPLWLSGLQLKSVRADIQPKLERYQREAASVLWTAFKPQILRAATASEPTGDTAIQELQRIVDMGEAMAQMARQQIELQQQQHVLDQRLNKAGQVVRGIQVDVADIQVRLGTVEDKLHPHAYITDEQSAHLAATVKALAELLTEKHGKNQYQGIYNELYRRFGVSGYKLIRREQYEGVLAFLEDWRHAAIKGTQLPDSEAP